MTSSNAPPRRTTRTPPGALARWARSMPLHLQILTVFLALQGSVLVSSLALVDRAQTRRAYEDLGRRLGVTRDVLRALLERREREIAGRVEVLGRDFAFRQAIAGTRDPATIRSAALNLQRRVGADRVWVTDARGRLYADTASRLSPGENLSVGGPFAEALSGRTGSEIQVLGGLAHQVVAVPVEAPDLIAVLAAGFALTDETAQELQGLTRTDLSFVVGGKAVASSLPPEARQPGWTPGLGPPEMPFESVAPDGSRRILLPHRLSPEVTVLIQLGLDEALAPARRLKKLLASVGLVGFALTALMGYYFAQDVTASIQRLVRDLQSANEELSRLNRFQSNFFSMVVHDLKSPLNAVTGYAEMASMSRAGEGVRDHLSKILNASRSLERLTADLVDFAAIETGTLRMKFGPMDLERAVREAASHMEILARRRSIRFTLEANDPLPGMQGDPARIAQAVLNLVGNALQYTPEGGAVTLAVRPDGGGARVEVRDTGIGIPPEEMARIFERFFQGKEASRMRGGGLGLGLKIAREIAQAHGGRLEVKSRPGQGCVFSLVLPPSPPPAENSFKVS